MKIITKSLLTFQALLISSIVLAQTDTGGGMGGTGVREKPSLVAPANSESPLTECTKEKSIGIYQRKAAPDDKVKAQAYVCEGQLLETAKGEHIELHLRSGEKIIIFEKSRVRVSTSK
jgi:hypothetical protein